VEITTERMADEVIVRPHGDLNGTAAPTLERTLMAALDSPAPRLVVDLADVGYISSMCLHVLLRVYRRMQEERRSLELRHAQPAVHEVLMLVGLGELLALDAG